MIVQIAKDTGSGPGEATMRLRILFPLMDLFTLLALPYLYVRGRMRERQEGSPHVGVDSGRKSAGIARRLNE